MLESSITLSEQYELLKKEQKEAKLAEEKTKQQLQRKKEEVVRSNKVRLTRSASILDLPVSFTSCLFETLLKVKLHFFSESVRKTGVCSSKTAAEQLQTRQEEVPGQKPRVDGREEPSGGGEEQVLVPSEVLAFTIRTVFFLFTIVPSLSTIRLANELEESERKLKALTEEQNEEQCRWQEELEELRREMQLARKKAEEAELEALQNEKAAVEKQRDVAMTHIEAWYKEVRR